MFSCHVAHSSRKDSYLILIIAFSVKASLYQFKNPTGDCLPDKVKQCPVKGYFFYSILDIFCSTKIN
nr:MAG TPA: hypothetical protein [Caudoviricetes sp.]